MISLVQDLVSIQANRNPEKLMIQDGNNSISYGEMESFTNKFARFLAETGVERGNKVAFCMEKSIDSFKALFAILKADCAYIPLDYKAPPDRLNIILRDCGCKYIITNEAGLPKTQETLKNFDGNANIILLVSNKSETSASDIKKKGEDSLKGIEIFPVDDLDSFENRKINYFNIDSDIAYIIYTSGSTGTPKGVIITHKSIIDYALWTSDYFNIKPDDRLSSHAMLHFDLSVFDIYTAFKGGASLHIVPPEASMFPVKFLEFVEEQKLTVWCSVPSFLTYVAKSGVLKTNRIPSLRAITFCGEVMPPQTIIEWMKVYPNIRYINQYGPTETTCASMYYEINKIPEDPSVPIPIGKAIPNTETFAIKDSNRLVKPGEIGELLIRGVGNSLGYWNNLERTKKAFIQNPVITNYREIVYATGDLARLRSDGLYDFVGRKDSQIKYMGYRIEPGDIENALDSISSIATSAVLGIDDVDMGGMLIVAFFCSHDGASVDSIKKELENKLPSYMIPKKFFILDKMLFNQNGKIDRPGLKKKYFEIK